MHYTVKEIEEISKEIRREIIKMAYSAGGSHIAPSFSCVEILTAIYFGGVMKYDSQNPHLSTRDRFILSKGHASAALYAVLAKAGFIEKSLLASYCKKGTVLGGHPKMHEIPGVEASTGALGHGLLFAQGIALAGKMNAMDYSVFVLLGDGECQEGSIWEAALFASQNKLGHLVAIIDYNKLQAMDKLDHIVGMEPFAEKWKAFGWNVVEVDGHDVKALVDVLGRKESAEAQPQLIIAHTVKGRGLSFMENQPIWHYRLPNDEEMQKVLTELEFEEQGWLKK